MNNYIIKKFEQTIIEDINNCQLPVGTAYFILKNICTDLEKVFNNCVIQESKIEEKEKTFFQKVEEGDEGDGER